MDEGGISKANKNEEEQKKQKYLRKKMRADKKKQRLLLKSITMYKDREDLPWRASEMSQAEEAKRDTITDNKVDKIDKVDLTALARTRVSETGSERERETLTQEFEANKYSKRFQLPGLMTTFGKQKRVDSIEQKEQDDDEEGEDEGSEYVSRSSERLIPLVISHPPPPPPPPLINKPALPPPLQLGNRQPPLGQTKEQPNPSTLVDPRPDIDSFNVIIDVNKPANRQPKLHGGNGKLNLRLNATNISSANPTVGDDDRHRRRQSTGKKLLHSLFKEFDAKDKPPPSSKTSADISDTALKYAAESLAVTKKKAERPLTVRANLQRLSIVLAKSTAPSATTAISDKVTRDLKPKALNPFFSNVFSDELDKAIHKKAISADLKGTDEPDLPEDDDDDLPPPEEEEAIPKSQTPSPLNIAVLSQIKQKPVLRRVEAPTPKTDPRSEILSVIKKGQIDLRKVDIESIRKPKDNEQNIAIAAILANRSKIAGDSDSDESESSFSDDDYG